MFRELGSLKRALGIDQRQNIDELLRLGEAIRDYGRMLQENEQWENASGPPYTIVEIPELALRFRESERNIIDALTLLQVSGFAEPVLQRRKCWRVKIATTRIHSQDEAA
jgi:hypothetical protein